MQDDECHILSSQTPSSCYDGIGGAMNKTIRQILFCTPRVLGILFTVFITLFSLDVFEMGGGFWATLGGFLIHNIPTIVLLAVLIIGWHRDWVGAVGFLAVGLWFLRMANPGDWLFALVFVGIPLLVGVLFLAGWIFQKIIRDR
jgi:hypothetical protein